MSSSLLLFKRALCYVSGCCKNDKRKHGQKVWFILACSSGRRLWLWAHTWSQKSSLYVFWRDCGSLYLEVLMKRKWNPLMNYSCIYIYNFWHIIPWKIYWSVLKIFNINHHHHSGQNIFHHFLSCPWSWCFKLAVHCVKKCQFWWLDLKAQALPRQIALLGLCKFC